MSVPSANDVTVEVTITPAEAKTGTKRAVEYVRHLRCLECMGTSYLDPPPVAPAQTGRPANPMCLRCWGKGLHGKDCPECGGRRGTVAVVPKRRVCTGCTFGQLTYDVKVDVEIPANKKSGEKVYIVGRGNEDVTGKSGNVIVVIHVGEGPDLAELPRAIARVKR